MPSDSLIRSNLYCDMTENKHPVGRPKLRCKGMVNRHHSVVSAAYTGILLQTVFQSCGWFSKQQRSIRDKPEKQMCKMSYQKQTSNINSNWYRLSRKKLSLLFYITIPHMGVWSRLPRGICEVGIYHYQPWGNRCLLGEGSKLT